MNRKEILLKIKEAAVEGGFTKLDVMPFFIGMLPSDVDKYLEMAYNLGFISVNANNPLCMYPTGKLLKLN